MWLDLGLSWLNPTKSVNRMMRRNSVKDLDEVRKRALRRLPASNLVEASIDPEVRKTLLHWKQSGNSGGILIGGLAMAFYAKPRFTQDVDLLFRSATHIPNSAQGFRTHRKGAMEDKDTGVEVEIVHPHSFNPPLSESLIQKIVDTVEEKDGINVVSAEGLIALKLHAATNTPKRELQDSADIANILTYQDQISLDTMKDWPLSSKDQKLFIDILKKVRS